MTDSTYSEWDLLELISLQEKARWEGDLRYTIENWDWRFDDFALNLAALEGRHHPLAQALRDHRYAINDWWAEHGKAAADLLNEHRGRQEARLKAEAGR